MKPMQVRDFDDSEICESDSPYDSIEDRFACKAPFPWFGGKSKAASLVWQLLGDVEHYCEPFAGSLAVLLGRPHQCNRAYHSETVNDLDGFIVNAWRAIALAPDATAEAASWPVTEADKTARQIALLKWRDETGLERLAGDATWCDPMMAWWWLWAVAVQIGAFDGRGPWTADPATGRIVKIARSKGPGVVRNRPHISNDGRGVNNQTIREPGVKRDANASDFHPVTMPRLRAWFALLSARLRHVRILNGDWSRLCTKGALQTISVRFQNGAMTGIFLDPPYTSDIRARGLYQHDSGSVTQSVRDWCIAAGANPKYRIVLAGFDVEHRELENHGWSVHEWFKRDSLTAGGMGSQQHRERLWASPHCLAIDARQSMQLDMFG